MSTTPKTILVTGGNKGIGLEICRQLAHTGHHVILSARSPERGKKAVQDLEDSGAMVEFLELDTASEESILRASGELKERLSALHVLVNNAAILKMWQGTILEVTPEDLRETMDTNLIGPILLTKALLPLLEAGKPSRIINVSSQLGSVKNMTDGWPSYGISKAALNAATRKLAVALRPRGISVIAASPGWVRTDMGGKSASLSVEQGARNIIKVITDVPPDATNVFLGENGEIPW
jgi:NAD(P)-dependent dehydrogenase (short-subunit alcohol dehydrogenase family)